MNTQKQESNMEIELALGVSEVSPHRRQQLTSLVQERGAFTAVVDYLSASDRRRGGELADICVVAGIHVIPLTSSRYPRLLRESSSPPPVLFVRALSASFEIPSRCLGIVGTRSASMDVCFEASEISRELASSGFCIVSGLALGIDGAAHRGALSAEGSCPTIAVLAHGLDRVYPATHVSLADRILRSGGVLISEYAPGTGPLKHHFLARNRIIAGLSEGLVVVQAGARSGSLVTAQFAADYGRDVFIVESEPDDERSAGSRGMLEQGAIPIRSARDVLKEYGMVSEPESGHGVPPRVMSIATFLEQEKLSMAAVLELEVRGFVQRLPGNRIRVTV